MPGGLHCGLAWWADIKDYYAIEYVQVKINENERTYRTG
jgi:hypothetical protein